MFAAHAPVHAQVSDFRSTFRSITGKHYLRHVQQVL